MSKRGYGENTVIKRKEEHWTATLVLANGTRTHVRSATCREALRTLREATSQARGVPL